MIRDRFSANDDFDLNGHHIRDWRHLSDIPQGGATTDQALVWDGTAWTPTTLSQTIVAGTVNWTNVIGKPDTYPPEAHTHTLTDLGAIGDAPADSTLYGRFDGDWQSVNTWLGGGTAETVAAIQFDTSLTAVPSEGMIAWNDDDGTLCIGMPGGNVVQQVGEEIYVRVANKTGSDLTNGTIVYISGAQGNRPTVAPANASSSASAQEQCPCGMLTEDIDNNANGYMVTLGQVHDVDTSLYSEGDMLWLKTDGSGGYTSTMPSAPDANVFIGRVLVSSATVGVILFYPRPARALSLLSDVNGTTPSSTNIHLIWDNSNSYWDAGQIDHGTLAGLSDNDHPQYSLTNHTHTSSFCINAVFNGNGSTVATTGSQGLFRLPADCTLVKASIVSIPNGTVSVSILSCTYGAFPTGLADVTGGTDLDLTSAAKMEDSTLSGWTTSYGVGDIFKYNITGTPSGATYATMSLFFEKVI